jgi:hypothetical protein
MELREAIEELKSCPFCGKPGQIISARHGFQVMCTNDCISMPGFEVYFTSEQAATIAWNTRALLTSAPQEGEEKKI